MENTKVKVKNMVNSPVTVMSRALNFQREWPNKGAELLIDSNVLEQLMFEPGVKYMFDSGILYIEELQVKQELGLEPEGVDEPVNIIVLTDKERRQYMVNLPLDVFKEKVDALAYEQVEELVDYAIENKLLDFEKCDYLKEKCGRDIINAVRLSKLNKED